MDQIHRLQIFKSISIDHHQIKRKIIMIIFQQSDKLNGWRGNRVFQYLSILDSESINIGQLIAYNYFQQMTQTVYTWQEVGKHNTETDLWIVIDDKVYDVSQYSNQHPGGPIVLLNKAGKNASLAFEQASHSRNAKENVMPKYLIGKIDPNSTMQQWQRQEAATAPNIFLTVAIVILILVVVYYSAA